MMDIEKFERRVRRLEDRIMIDELIARYTLVIDNRDMDAMPDLFMPDVTIRSVDGMLNVTGRSAAVEMYHGRFKILGLSNHVTHDRIITFSEDDENSAHGLVSGHAEMQRPETGAMVAAIRYHDEYGRDGACWRFRSRTLAFFYYVSASEYLDALGPGCALRNRARAEPRAADWPEPLPTWKQYYGSKTRPD